MRRYEGCLSNMRAKALLLDLKVTQNQFFVLSISKVIY
jgi:hypothetical protein